MRYKDELERERGGGGHMYLSFSLTHLVECAERVLRGATVEVSIRICRVKLHDTREVLNRERELANLIVRDSSVMVRMNVATIKPNHSAIVSDRLSVLARLREAVCSVIEALHVRGLDRKTRAIVHDSIFKAPKLSPRVTAVVIRRGIGWIEPNCGRVIINSVGVVSNVAEAEATIVVKDWIRWLQLNGAAYQSHGARGERQERERERKVSESQLFNSFRERSFHSTTQKEKGSPSKVSDARMGLPRVAARRWCALGEAFLVVRQRAAVV